MPSERRFRRDGMKDTRFYEDDGDDQILANSGADFEIRHHQPERRLV